MFPLFSEEYDDWKKKLYFYNNYDLLTIINLLANRSFRDLYQYPIFPILYKSNNMFDNEIKGERDLSKHIGIQELNEKCKERKKKIKESYDTTKEENDETPCLFNTHYSNIVYVSNYLIRLFPYCLTAIELQGDGFDNPNRLFYSIKKAMENTLTQKSDLREYIPELYYLPDLFTNNNNLKLGTLSNGQDIDSILINENTENKDEPQNKKYEFIAELKNYLENGKLKLNEWIDLIFGVHQEKTKRLDNYEKDMYIHIEEEQQIKECNDTYIMKKFEFGIQPFKIFESKFPDLKDKSSYFNEIKEYNIEQFNKEHFIIKGDKNKCFKYEGYNNKTLDYIEILRKKSNNKKKPEIISDFQKYFKDKEELMIFFHYIFIGDVLGNVSIYENKMKFGNRRNNSIKPNEKSENEENRKPNKENQNDDNKNRGASINTNNELNYYKKIKVLTDHNKQIKYIDYNQRLNLFLSYSLDGFINIYVFPKCKLVRTIKVTNFTNDILKKVVLVSNPFPMIFTYDINNMYLFTINGELINKKELENKNIEIYPCIDKNCGLVNDCIYFEDLNSQENKKKKEEISFSSFFKEDILNYLYK